MTRNDERRCFRTPFLSFRDERGIALILVLWVMTLLSVMATQFAYSMRSEASITRNFREETEAHYLSKAGVHLAVREILQEADLHTRDGSRNLAFFKIPPVKAAEEPVHPKAPNRSGIRVGDQEVGLVEYEIRDEDGKLNLNGLNDQQTKLLLKQCGGMEEGAELDELVNSIMDWKDLDQNHRAGGAEDDYYESLDPPYQSKDANFDTLEELLLVKGMTRDLYDRITPHLTVWPTRSLNKNTATPCALEVIGTKVEDREEIQKAISEKGYFNTDKSSFFTVRSRGYLPGEEISRTVTAVLEKVGSGATQGVRIHYWNDNYFDPSRAIELFFESSTPEKGDSEKG
jgi:general secretion pathway protein K